MKLIAAVTENWGIGKDGGLLFSIPDDMRFFRETTKGAVVIMGRKTLESFPGGRPLKGRDNLVLTRDSSFSRDGVRVFHSVEDVLSAAGEYEDRDLFVIGGGEVYRQLLPYCSKAYITKMDITLPADSFFPNLDAHPGWTLAESGQQNEHEGVKYAFCTYVNTAEKE